MALGHILTRIERVATIIAMDAKNPLNRERALEIQKLVQLARQEKSSDGGNS